MNQADINDLDRRSYEIACPWCGARKGARCEGARGPLDNWTHIARKWATPPKKGQQ